MRVELTRSKDSDGETSICIELLESGGIELHYHDIGPAAARTFGSGEYEAWMRVAADDMGRLAFALLAEKFADMPDALSALRAFCEQRAISFEAGGWS